MAYDKEKYEKLRSLHVPREIALALADDESPLGAGGPDLPLGYNASSLELGDGATLAQVVDAHNALVSVLRYGGVIERS